MRSVATFAGLVGLMVSSYRSTSLLHSVLLLLVLQYGGVRQLDVLNRDWCGSLPVNVGPYVKGYRTDTFVIRQRLLHFIFFTSSDFFS